MKREGENVKSLILDAKKCKFGVGNDIRGILRRIFGILEVWEDEI
jgi:hypothetical protein